MELSCKCEYAVLALLSLVDHYPQGEPLRIRQIAAQQHIPDRYLEQLLAILRRSGLVCSQRGARGGYLLAREPWKITLLEIINCIEGRDPQSNALPQNRSDNGESGSPRTLARSRSSSESRSSRIVRCKIFAIAEMLKNKLT